MPLCVRCGQPNDRDEDICSACLAEEQQPTASFAPVAPGKVQAPVDAPGVDGELRLVIVKGPQMGDYFVLDASGTSIGRNPAADVFLNDQTVSREHAEILVLGDVVLIRDRGSLNGTYVNGLVVDEAELRDGDIVQIGTFHLAFRRGARG